MSKTHVVSNQDHVSVMYVEKGKPAVAEADWLGDHWWVARVQVPMELGRGRGIGTTIVERMLAEMQKQRPASTVVVIPGGYNEPPAKQRRFYERFGFSPVAKGWLEMQVGDRKCERN